VRVSFSRCNFFVKETGDDIDMTMRRRNTVTQKDHEMERQWIEKNGLVLTSAHICFRAIGGLDNKNCEYRKNLGPYRLYCIYGCKAVPCGELLDHPQLFRRKDTREYWLTAHPYDISNYAVSQKNKLETEFGLQVEIHGKDKSWYCPGGTHLVVIRPRGRQ
jgi:hypothetical protein